MDFIVTKRGLASMLHSGDPAFQTLPAYFSAGLSPALARLLQTARDAGPIGGAVEPDDLLHAVRCVCVPNDDGTMTPAQRSVQLLVDGLRHRAPADRKSPRLHSSH